MSTQIKPDMVSEHISWHEVVNSEAAERFGIDNTLPVKYEQVAVYTAEQMEKVRRFLRDWPIHINSFYRCLQLNRLLRSADNSKHRSCEAVDFICPNFGTPKEIFDNIVSAYTGSYDQLILEKTWVHISWKYLQPEQNRHEHFRIS